MIKFTEIDVEYEGRELTDEDRYAIGLALFHGKGIFNQDDTLKLWSVSSHAKNISEVLDEIRFLIKKFKNNQ